jgi:predicted acylesterase/phospholipase RssA
MGRFRPRRVPPQPRRLEQPAAAPAMDTALVLSGGSINGIFLQLGFLQAIRASDLWPAVGWVYGTSAGAFSGWAAALDAIDEHERFLMELQPDDVFAAHDLWRAALVGLHRYTLPETVARRLGDPVELARRIRQGPRELTVVTVDIGLSPESSRSEDPYERAFNSRRDPPETLADAVFASGAISTFVLPLRIEQSVYADGGWVRNFPLAYAYREPAVHRIVGCRYRASALGFTGTGLHSWHHRMSRLSRIKVGRAVTAELRDAIERQARGEPMHLIDTISRLSHIAVYRNSDLEVQLADERDQSLRAVHDVRERMQEVIAGSTRGRQRDELLDALDEAFEAADFPFKRSRVVPRLVVDLALPEGVRLDITRRNVTWSDEDKLALARHGRRLTENALEQWAEPGSAAPPREVGDVPLEPAASA